MSKLSDLDRTRLTPTNLLMTDGNPFAPVRRGRRAMEFLAGQLANNYFDVTFGYPPKPETLEREYAKVFGGAIRDFNAEPRARNVLLVGAGVSYAAFGGELFPLALDAISRMHDMLGVPALQKALGEFDRAAHKEKDLRNRFEEEEHIFETVYNVPNPRSDFETQLAILSKFFTPRQIRGALHEIYNLRYFPHISFEILAHLLKHRYVDAVINYNFDEVLDQAIKEEVRGGDSRYVISDGNAQNLEELVVNDSLKVPLYIKPHGTIGHKSTLRFTKDEYVEMPTDLRSFTKKILLGHTRENPDEQPDKFYVNLISIGFAFTSVELIELLREHPRLRVFHINLGDDRNAADLFAQVSRIGNVEQYLIGINPTRDEGEPGKPRESWPTIADALRDLFQQTYDRFEIPYKPRHISRHEIVHRVLFSGGERPRSTGARIRPAWPAGAGGRIPEDERDYHLARLCVELAIELAKRNGRIDLSTLVRDRVGIYFRNWRDKDRRRVGSLRSICRDYFKLKDDQGFGGDIFTIPVMPGATTLDAPLRKALAAWDAAARFMDGTHEFGYRIWLLLRDALLKIDDTALKTHVHAIDRESFGMEVVLLLARLVHSDVQELAPRFSPDAQLLLNKHSPEVVLHTQLGMSARFVSMLEDPEWDLLLSISELGKVLKNVPLRAWSVDGPDGQRFRKASIIVSDSYNKQILETRLGRYRENGWIIGQDYRLPYWAHNHHMIITLKMARGTFEPLAAISYRVPGLENRVNPVYIEDRDDLEMLVQIYFGHLVKAESYMKLDRDERALSEVFPVVHTAERGGVSDVEREQARKARTELLARWWHAMKDPPSSSA